MGDWGSFFFIQFISLSGYMYICICLYIYIYIYIYILYIYICTYIWYSFWAKVFRFAYRKLAQVRFESTSTCLPCTCSNHWDIWFNDETCFALILNFPKCSRQNQTRESFSCSLPYHKFPARINLCCLQQIPLN